MVDILDMADGLSLQVDVTYLVDIPQKDIDEMINRCTTHVTPEEIAADLAKLNIEANQETPLSFEVQEIKEN